MGKAKKLKFEEAVEQLEQIIDGIEYAVGELEESLAQYEKGMALITQCRAILSTAEKRIAELTSDEKNGLTIAKSDGQADPTADADDEGPALPE